MIGYGGATTNKESVEQLARGGFGMIIAPQNPKISPIRYAVDNGAYYCWTRKMPWDEKKFLKLLDRVEKFDRVPDFGCAPDIVAGGLRSLEFSMSWVDRLPKEFPWYLAVQDGMTEADVAQVIEKFAGLFVGGTSEWKMRTLPEWVRLAKSKGKKAHVGRVNSLSRAFTACQVCKADSFDGTNWNRTWDNVKKPDRVIRDAQQGALDLWGLH